MFTENQKKELEKKLDPSHVRMREQGGRNVSYVEGWHAIAEANRIFGFDGWSRETIYMKQVCHYTYNGKEKVGYEAKVRITAGNISREGTGNGSGISKDLYDAIEGACKEAETDAMKRALMTFGNPFGLALYDKEKANVGREPERFSSPEEAKEWAKPQIEALEAMPLEEKYAWVKVPENYAALKWAKQRFPKLYERFNQAGLEVE